MSSYADEGGAEYLRGEVRRLERSEARLLTERDALLKAQKVWESKLLAFTDLAKEFVTNEETCWGESYVTAAINKGKRMEAERDAAVAAHVYCDKERQKLLEKLNIMEGKK